MADQVLTVGQLMAKTWTVAWRRKLILLGWGLVLFSVCLPCSVFIMRELNLGPFDPISLWKSLAPLGKLAIFLTTWFVSLGSLGLTQAVTTIATWDDQEGKPTTLRNLASRLLPKLHRILGLQLLVVPIMLILVPLTMFTITAVFLDDCSVFAGVRKSLNLLSRYTGKAILMLFFAWIAALVLRITQGPLGSLRGRSLLYLGVGLESRMAMFYLAGVLVGIPTTLLYWQGKGPRQSPSGGAERSSAVPGAGGSR